MMGNNIEFEWISLDVAKPIENKLFLLKNSQYRFVNPKSGADKYIFQNLVGVCKLNGNTVISDDIGDIIIEDVYWYEWVYLKYILKGKYG